MEKIVDPGKLFREKRIRSVVLLVITIIFLIFSTINIASASFFSSANLFSREYVFIKKQFIFLLVSLLLLPLFMKIDYRIYKKSGFQKLLYFGSALLFGVLLIASFLKIDMIAPMVNGSRRWINLGITRVQPSEILKIAYIMIMAKKLSECDSKGYVNLRVILEILPITVAFILAVFFQKDLGTAVHYLAIATVMIFISKVSLKYFMMIVAALSVVVAIYVGISYFEIGEQSYRNIRIKTFITGLINDEYNNDEGYQIKQSLIALGNGGILGRGFGYGLQKYSYLPEIHTDFILASLGEEWGFVTLFFIVLAFYSIIRIAFITSLTSKDLYGRYLAVGIGGFILVQTLMNTYVVTGLMPVKGIPLPLLSYGGSSLWTVVITMGILINISSVNSREEMKHANKEKGSGEKNI